jgi:regulator of sirC expression with transglutaminase-like and TPR domain
MGSLIHSTRLLFEEEARRPEVELDLARACLLVAKEQYAQLPVGRYLTRLDQLAEEVKDRLNEETAPLIVLQELLQSLFVRHGFKGNRDAYYDPRNSFLNDVLDRRLGIPLSLGVVLLEVGWRLGLPLEGVDFPHHFLVRFRGESEDLLIDAFDEGRIRYGSEAQELLDRVYGGMVRLREDFLRRATKRDVLVRLLRNLKSVYLNVREDRQALAAVERLLLLRPDLVGENRVGGLLSVRLGRREEALEYLRAYLEAEPRARDVERIRSLVERLSSDEDVTEDVSDEEVEDP